MSSDLINDDHIFKEDKEILKKLEQIINNCNKGDCVNYADCLYIYDKLNQLIKQIYLIFKISDSYQNELIRTREKLEEKIMELRNISSRDQLTGLYNRREFEKTIKDEWRYVIRERKPISLIMIDIDNFKAFNDNYGHLAGDDCLQKLSQSMENCLNRPRDFIARFGGEEFVIILSETDDSGAKYIAEKIRKIVYDIKIPHKYSNVEKYITISLGIANTNEPGLFVFEELLDEADKALYEAKESGKNKYCIRKLEY